MDLSLYTGRDRARMMARIRDKFTCQDCGSMRTPKKAKREKKKLFDIHHLNGLCGEPHRPKRYDSVKDLRLLITLCRKCHFNRPDHSRKNFPKPLPIYLQKRNENICIQYQTGSTLRLIALIEAMSIEGIRRVLNQYKIPLRKRGRLHTRKVTIVP